MQQLAQMAKKAKAENELFPYEDRIGESELDLPTNFNTFFEGLLT